MQSKTAKWLLVESVLVCDMN